ncbi:MAG: hypothetical protein L0Z49_09700 [Actinobacteria bacterium]|nr:hypothetical protein [Actinomycetota bacterium]
MKGLTRTAVIAALVVACDGAVTPATSLEPTSTTSPMESTVAPPEVTTTHAEGPSTTVLDDFLEVGIVGGEVLGGPRDLAVGIGEEVFFRVASDTADELHVHGYDLFYELEPGVATEVRFVADVPGVFEIELEGSHTLVVELTVS